MSASRPNALPGPDGCGRKRPPPPGLRSRDRRGRRSPTRGYVSDALAAIGALAAAAALGVITAAIFALVSPRATAPFGGSSGLGALNDSVTTSGR